MPEEMGATIGTSALVEDELHPGRTSCRDTSKEEPMTKMPEDLPSIDEFRRKSAYVDREFADARRYLSALHAKDYEALGALMAEIHHSERAMKILAAMAVLALDLADLAADRLGGDVQEWLEGAAMAQDAGEVERGRAELGGEG
jgi:hypothetical protein